MGIDQKTKSEIQKCYNDVVRRKLGIDQKCTNAFIYTAANDGGLGVTNPADTSDAAVVAEYFLHANSFVFPQIAGLVNENRELIKSCVAFEPAKAKVAQMRQFNKNYAWTHYGQVVNALRRLGWSEFNDDDDPIVQRQQFEMVRLAKQYLQKTFQSNEETSIFTDGSYKKGCCGAGLYIKQGSRVGEFYARVQNVEGVLGAELAWLAVLAETPRCQNADITVSIDSKNAIKILRNDASERELLKMQDIEMIRRIKLSSLNGLRIHKVKAHQGVYGNERADALAKIGREQSDLTIIAPHTLRWRINGRNGEVRGDINKCIKKEWSKYWLKRWMQDCKYQGRWRRQVEAMGIKNMQNWSLQLLQSSKHSRWMSQVIISQDEFRKCQITTETPQKYHCNRCDAPYGNASHRIDCMRDAIPNMCARLKHRLIFEGLMNTDEEKILKKITQNGRFVKVNEGFKWQGLDDWISKEFLYVLVNRTGLLENKFPEEEEELWKKLREMYLKAKLGNEQRLKFSVTDQFKELILGLGINRQVNVSLAGINLVFDQLDLVTDATDLEGCGNNCCNPFDGFSYEELFDASSFCKRSQAAGYWFQTRKNSDSMNRYVLLGECSKEMLHKAMQHGATMLAIWPAMSFPYIPLQNAYRPNRKKSVNPNMVVLCMWETNRAKHVCTISKLWWNRLRQWNEINSRNKKRIYLANSKQMKGIRKNICQEAQTKDKEINYVLWKSICADSMINTTAFLTGWYRELHELNVSKIQKADRKILRKAHMERNHLMLRRQAIIAEEARELLRRKYCISKNAINGQRFQNKVHRHDKYAADSACRYLNLMKGAHNTSSNIGAGWACGTL